MGTKEKTFTLIRQKRGDKEYKQTFTKEGEEMVIRLFLNGVQEWSWRVSIEDARFIWANCISQGYVRA